MASSLADRGVDWGSALEFIYPCVTERLSLFPGGGTPALYVRRDARRYSRPPKLTVTAVHRLLNFPLERLSAGLTMQALATELKSKIIESLKLQDITPEQIDDETPLFGTGLGLDSIDALELVVMLEKHYGIVIKDIEVGRPAFKCVRTLAEFIQAKRPAPPA
jgi:acyl carrier protein